MIEHTLDTPMVDSTQPSFVANAPGRQVDIFCRVIDNYGDIGVCWRLARRLGDGLGWQVRLWVDDLGSFARLAPALDPASARQLLGTIEIVQWNDDTCFAPGDLVIEAFACDPPASFIAAMKARPVPPVWINLEYLSAESWVASFHAQASLRGDGLSKTFFFPGFGPDTGGLLREPGLLAERDAVQYDTTSRQATLHTLGLPQAARAIGATDSTRLANAIDDPGMSQRIDGCRLATLFCYPDIDLAAVFEALARTGPWIVTIPHGVAVNAEALALPLVGSNATRPALTIERFDLLSQPDYDRLLWCADLNIVRGEDSFVRAQWAARPMLWHIYPQDDGAHGVKLDAWLNACGCPGHAAAAMRAMNAHISISLVSSLTAALLPPNWDAWQTRSTRWTRHLGEMSDLADNLVAHYAQATNSR